NSTTSIDRDQIREKVLAHLISMTVQLKYLLVERFEWLLHVVEYLCTLFDEVIFDDLIKYQLSRDNHYYVKSHS
ncbi:unnamed protein product, partial [Rotaria sp. Silwood1]